MPEKVKSKRVLLAERDLLLDCIRILRNFKVNEHTEEKVESVYKFLEINDLSDTRKLETALYILREDDDDGHELDEAEDLINGTILDLEFLVQQIYNKI
jgi:hypothetical protein